MKTVEDFTCKSCGRTDLVLPHGNLKSPVMIVGEEPNEDELQTGQPFTGSGGRIMKKELGKLGFSTHNATLTNLWLHTKNENEECFNDGLERVLKLSKGKSLVLLLGSNVVNFFTDYSVMQVAGLIVESSYFSGKVMACPNPASIFYGAIGEVRLSLEKFMREVRKLK